MSNKNGTEKKSGLLNMIAMAGLAGLTATPALAQQAPAPAADETIVVTGYRAALQSSTNAKRNSTAFTDSVFAEDIGKFPDLNIAESLNRIPGVQLTRDSNGEGTLIAVRGLGTSFTKVMLNGAQIAVASSAGTDQQNQNREVDLSLFPTEMFARLDVQKTPTAAQIEGGTAGIVNMRSARPFDYQHDQITYQLQEQYQNESGEYSPRGAIMASKRWQTSVGEFGVLAGFAGVHNVYTTEGWESGNAGWTNANLTDAQCGVAATPGGQGNNVCNSVGGRQVGNAWSIPNTVPAGAGAGLVAGQTIDAAFLTLHNPGLTTTQIGQAMIPRLSRESYQDGFRDRFAGVVSLQYRPNDATEFYLDVLSSMANRDYDRIDMNFVGRSGASIPTDMKVVQDGVHTIVTDATFANAQWFLEARHYHDKIEFLNINPGGEFDITDWLHWSVQLNYSRSNFFRDSPTILVNSPLGQGVTIHFQNAGTDFPHVTSNFALNDPNAGWTWAGGRVNVQQEKRVTSTEGFHTDLRFGNEHTNIRVGAAWDEATRVITGRDNSQAWQNFVCGGGVIGIVSPNPACTGGAGSAITQASLASYLAPSPAGFITVDFKKFEGNSNYAFYDRAPQSSGSSTGATSGSIEEGNWGLWTEGNLETEVAGHTLRANAGVRYVSTDQQVSSPFFSSGVLTGLVQFYASYNKLLPSANVSYELLDNVTIRAAASRTLTRPNPSSLLPSLNYGDQSAQTASRGNPFLQPFTSDNIDIGGEWYTGQEGYIGIMLFQKKIEGFTTTQSSIVPFAALGVSFDQLSSTQQASILGNGGLANWTVTLSQPINLPGEQEIKGLELTWVQPLTFLLNGLGFTANYTNIDKVPSVTGVAQFTENVTVYFDRGPLSSRLSWTYADGLLAASRPQNNDPYADLLGEDRSQLDFSASYKFENLPTSPQLTLDVTNITEQPIVSDFASPEMTNTFYQPGRTILVGLRGTF